MSSSSSDIPASTFSTGLSSPDMGGLNSLGGGLTGPFAGSLPNGFTNMDGSFGNVAPLGTTSADGMSSGAMNGNFSFTMPNASSNQLTAQALSQGLGAGAKLANSPSMGQQPTPTGSGRVMMKDVNFANPIVDFAGSNGGSNIGKGLLQLLAKYHPGR